MRKMLWSRYVENNAGQPPRTGGAHVAGFVVPGPICSERVRAALNHGGIDAASVSPMP